MANWTYGSTSWDSGWFYNSHNGLVQFVSGVQFFTEEGNLHLGLGLHGPFPSQADAENFAAAIKGVAPDNNKNAATQLRQEAQGLGSTAINGSGSPSGGVSLTSLITQPSTWVRVVEVALGIILLAIGVARMTGTQNTISQLVKARIP